MELLSIFKILYKHKWLIICIPLISAVAAFIFTSGYKSTYKSTAQLATGFTIAEEVKITDERFNLYESDVKFNNLIETLNSPRVLSLLAYRLLIHDLSFPNSSFRNIVEKKKELSNLGLINTEQVKQLLLEKLDSMKSLVPMVKIEHGAIELLEAYGYNIESLKEDLQVTRINRTDYVSVIALSEDPFLSAFMVNVLCEEFLRYSSSLTTSRSNQSVRVFSQLVAQKKKELDEKAEELRKFKSSNNLLNFSAETETKITQIAELELKREEERRNLRSLKLNLSDLNGKISKAEESDQNLTNAKILELRKSINTLNQQYLNTGSRNQALANAIENQREELRILMSQSNQTNNSSGDLESLILKRNELELLKQLSEQNIVAIEDKLDQLIKNAGGYASQEAQISSLERELELASEEYKNAQEKYNKSLDISLASGNSIQQILLGQPASEPEPSKRIIITGLSGISALFLCILVVVLIEYIDVSIKTISNFSATLPLTLIGSLSHLSFRKYSVESLFKSKREDLDHKSNTFRESLRKLRFELDKLEHKIYLFTSTKSGEGKTIVIDALATVLSLSGSKVLLIDTNFTNNSLTRTHKALPSLEFILINDDVNIHKAISKTKISEVDIIGCQGGNYSPIEIFQPESLSCLLKSLKDKYDYIFLEGAALNLYSDARELSEYVDGIITIFSAKSIIRQTDKESISFIKNLGCKNIGAVLNDVEIDNMET